MTVFEALFASGMFTTYDRGLAKVCLVLCISTSISNTFLVRIWRVYPNQRFRFFGTIGSVIALVMNIIAMLCREGGYDCLRGSFRFGNVYYL
jgi:hypothetical protein